MPGVSLRAYRLSTAAVSHFQLFFYPHWDKETKDEERESNPAFLLNGRWILKFAFSPLTLLSRTTAKKKKKSVPRIPPLQKPRSRSLLGATSLAGPKKWRGNQRLPNWKIKCYATKNAQSEFFFRQEIETNVIPQSTFAAETFQIPSFSPANKFKFKFSVFFIYLLGSSVRIYAFNYSSPQGRLRGAPVLHLLGGQQELLRGRLRVPQDAAGGGDAGQGGPQGQASSKIKFLHLFTCTAKRVFIRPKLKIQVPVQPQPLSSAVRVRPPKDIHGKFRYSQKQEISLKNYFLSF